ncbi:MAG: glycosyltransferase family 39 protein [Elusimicrobiota bacterium]
MRKSIAPAWGALASVCLGGTAWFLSRAPYAPTFDDAWYLETSFRLFSALRDGPFTFARAYADALHIKAPLIALIPFPLYALFGMSERAALWTGPALAAWTAWSVRKIARRLHGPAAGDAAGALTLAIPLLYGLSRVFFVETLLTALVSATISAILDARPGRRADAVRLGALVGLGLLAKSIFPIYIVLPLWLRRRELKPGAPLAFAVAAAVAGTWYAFNLPYVIGFGFSAGFGRIARDYGPASALAPAALWGYARGVIGDGLSWPLAAAGALTFILARQANVAPEARRLEFAWAAPLALFFLGVNKEIRYSLPVLPVFAVATAGAWSRLSGRARTAAGAILAAAALWVYGGQTFGAPPAAPLAYNGPTRSAGWDRGALVDALARAAGPDSVAAIALEHPAMNANTVASCAAARGLRWKTVSLGYAQPDAESALIRLKDKNADLLVLFNGVAEAELPAFLNRANAGVAAAIASGRLSARRVEEVAVWPGVTAVVWALARR